MPVKEAEVNMIWWVVPPETKRSVVSQPSALAPHSLVPVCQHYVWAGNTSCVASVETRTRLLQSTLLQLAFL